MTRSRNKKNKQKDGREQKEGVKKPKGKRDVIDRRGMKESKEG